MSGRHEPVAVTPFGDLLVAAAARRPDAEVLLFPESRTSTAELLAGARRAARALRALGVERGDRVGILMPNCVPFAEVLFGASLLGAVVVLVNARYRTTELAYVAADAGLRVIVTADVTADRTSFEGLLGDAFPSLPGAAEPRSLRLPEAPELRACVQLGPSSPPGFVDATAFAALAEAVDEQEVDDAADAVAVRDVAMVMYTSGTTAQPKGCRLTHEAVVRTAAAIVRRFELGADDTWWCPLPFFHMSGILPLAAALLAGSRLATMTDFDAATALRQIERERVTFHFGVFPTLNQLLVAHPDVATTDLGAVRYVGTQSGPPDLQRALRDAHPNARLLCAYGCTELGGIVSWTDPRDPGDEWAQTCGYPWPGMELRVVDPDGADVAPGEPGEIVARGWGVFDGYHGDAQLTARAIDADGWFHTGDVGSHDEAGRLRFHGRIKDMLKVGGENVAASEVEAYLATHPAVRLAQVVGVPDAHLVEVPAAFVELHPGAAASEDELVAFCRGRIASYKIPRHVRVVEEWPMSATKIQKFALRERLLAELEARGRGA